MLIEKLTDVNIQKSQTKHLIEAVQIKKKLIWYKNYKTYLMLPGSNTAPK